MATHSTACQLMGSDRGRAGRITLERLTHQDIQLKVLCRHFLCYFAIERDRLVRNRLQEKVENQAHGQSFVSLTRWEDNLRRIAVRNLDAARTPGPLCLGLAARSILFGSGRSTRLSFHLSPCRIGRIISGKPGNGKPQS